jgi:hypothetical protein
MMTISCLKINRLVKGKRDTPFSLRLTFEERARLEAAVSGVALAAYIKALRSDLMLAPVADPSGPAFTDLNVG